MDPETVFVAALERASQGPFDDDGFLSPEAEAEVEEILSMAEGSIIVPKLPSVPKSPFGNRDGKNLR